MICLDTGALIAAVQVSLRPDQQAHKDRLMPYLNKHLGSDRLLVPSVVLAEFLYGTPTAERAAQIVRLASTEFLVAPFDTRAADKAVEVRSLVCGVKEERAAIKEAGGTRVKFRADYQVLATAIVHGATFFITTDPALVTHAARFKLKASTIDNLPVVPIQQTLY